MPDLRIATFNCENLMMRCDFGATGIVSMRDRLTAIDDARLAETVDAAFNVLSDDDRTLTAQALAATGAEVCAVQEIENLVTLTAFDQRYVAAYTGAPFRERILCEGNDTRGIDVGVLSNLAVRRVTSHARETFGTLDLPPPRGASVNDNVFRRDCLEVDIEKAGRGLTLFVCHLKSMHGGRLETRGARIAETRAIRRLIARRFQRPADADWLILGDFNDYAECDGRALSDHGLGPLIDDGFAVDLLPQAIGDPLQRWTHYYPDENTYGALDHMFLSPRLAAQNPQPKAEIIRIGAPYRATRFDGFRLPGVGWDNPKASDHCPLVADLHFEGQAIG
jgi:endonuclease/exonuclease/phosphatase family metal-dependent hydrolase